MSEAMTCPACGASSAPEDRFCIACGATLPTSSPAGEIVIDRPRPSPPAAAGWPRAAVIGVVALALLAVAAGAAWIIARQEVSRLRAQTSALESRVSQLRDERAKLARPLVTGTRVFNGRLVDGRPGVQQYDGPFEHDAVYHIGYVISGPNQSFGVADVKGTLGVKYLGPDRSVFRPGQSGAGRYSLTQTVEIPQGLRAWQAYHSLGSNSEHVFPSGDWVIEWWWEDTNTKLGQATFKINPAPLVWPGFRFPPRY